MASLSDLTWASLSETRRRISERRDHGAALNPANRFAKHLLHRRAPWVTRRLPLRLLLTPAPHRSSQNC